MVQAPHSQLSNSKSVIPLRYALVILNFGCVPNRNIWAVKLKAYSIWLSRGDRDMPDEAKNIWLGSPENVSLKLMTLSMYNLFKFDSEGKLYVTSMLSIIIFEGTDWQNLNTP